MMIVLPDVTQRGVSSRVTHQVSKAGVPIRRASVARRATLCHANRMVADAMRFHHQNPTATTPNSACSGEKPS